MASESRFLLLVAATVVVSFAVSAWIVWRAPR